MQVSNNVKLHVSYIGVILLVVTLGLLYETFRSTEYSQGIDPYSDVLRYMDNAQTALQEGDVEEAQHQAELGALLIKERRLDANATWRTVLSEIDTQVRVKEEERLACIEKGLDMGITAMSKVTLSQRNSDFYQFIDSLIELSEESHQYRLDELLDLRKI